MAVVPENLEWSLPVASVKELSTQSLNTVPLRYIRDDADYPTAALSPSDPSLCVPLIDLAKIVDPQYQDLELQKLHLACKNWGIFQLINYVVSDDSLKNMKIKSQEFFNLSQEEKKRYAQKPGNLEGYGQAFVISEEQKLEWCDMIFLRTLPTHIRSLEFWPQQPPNYRETLHSYSEDIRKIAISIVGFIAMGLGLEAEEFSEAFKDGKYEQRMNCYPPCPQPEKVIGVASHADISGITLLLDCGETPGLQVLKDEQWVFVPPLADAIVVNIGNMIEIMSNGIYKAPYHRATVNKLKERLSMVTFCYPSTATKIGPSTQLIKRGNPALYKTLTVQDYFQSFFNWKLNSVPFIDTLKI